MISKRRRALVCWLAPFPEDDLPDEWEGMLQGVRHGMRECCGHERRPHIGPSWTRGRVSPTGWVNLLPECSQCGSTIRGGEAYYECFHCASQACAGCTWPLVGRRSRSRSPR